MDGPVRVGEERTSPPLEPTEFSLLGRLAHLLFFIICLEIGIFLIVFPWVPDWGSNYFSYLARDWARLWQSNFFRGAISGLGVLNVAVAIEELLILVGFRSPGSPGR